MIHHSRFASYVFAEQVLNHLIINAGQCVQAKQDVRVSQFLSRFHILDVLL